MKTIYLIRHAKSDWSVDSNDFDRPLNSRGNSDAPKMANILKEKDIKPDLMISSPALRAKTTAKYFSEILGYDFTKIQYEDKIYHGNYKNILDIISKIDNKINNVFIFGHNPDITMLVNKLSLTYLDNMPTCGVACVELNIENWIDDFESSKNNLKFFIYPKQY